MEFTNLRNFGFWGFFLSHSTLEKCRNRKKWKWWL